MFFLATPHQGAGIAQLLSRVLSVAMAGPVLSSTTSCHNQPCFNPSMKSFPDSAEKLKLFSFYETQPMYYGVGKGLIVEKHCAVMNYANESRAYLDANHRDVARFSSTSDPSYLLVRNTLATTINGYRRSLGSARQEAQQENERLVGRFLAFFGCSGR